MTFKTQKPSLPLGLRQNKKQTDDSLQRRARLTQSLKGAFNAGLICHAIGLLNQAESAEANL